MPGVSIACHRAECAHRDPSGTSLGPQYAALLRHPALRRRRGSPDVRVDERARLALQRRHLRKEQSRDEEPATGKLDDDGDTAIEANEDPGVPGGATYNVKRWNLQNPPHTATTAINVGDLNTLSNGAVGSPKYPPMFGHRDAFGRSCPVTRFVDAVSGNDNNSGASPAQAWRTLDKAETQTGSALVLFKRGQTWTGEFAPTNAANVMYGAYGTYGDPIPVITNPGGTCINWNSAAPAGYMAIINIAVDGCQYGVSVDSSAANERLLKGVLLANNSTCAVRLETGAAEPITEGSAFYDNPSELC